VGRDPVKFVKPKEMSEGEIQDVILAFGQAARRATEAGADGVQIFAAHGYLINEFLSPFFNRRRDDWGGSDRNRFRFLEEVFLEVRRALPKGIPILAKINVHDYTPKEGITPPLAAKYAGWLKDLGIDGLEVSCGSVFYSFMSTCRGDVPVRELLMAFPWWKRPLGRFVLKSLARRYRFHEAYNLEAARVIKAVLGEIPLLLVGGLRTVKRMEEILKQGDADMISMSRPFIRDPFLVKHIREGMDQVRCVSCNRCLAAALNELPVRCYNQAFPKE
jgi:2,4-dienoyl-CoA reductase-like NADH-dependent reductase (Old Yellow Enzyme family)